MAQQYYQLVGASASECDTIPGRQVRARQACSSGEFFGARGNFSAPGGIFRRPGEFFGIEAAREVLAMRPRGSSRPATLSRARSAKWHLGSGRERREMQRDVQKGE